MTKTKTNESITFMKKIYAIKDTGLNEFMAVQCMDEIDKDSYFVELANDVRSPYYQRVKDFDCYCLGEMNVETGVISSEYRGIICPLSNYIDIKRVEYQRLVQTLNFLPQGYFKMPVEKQQEIEKDIKNAISTYVEKYADLDKLSNQDKELN